MGRYEFVDGETYSDRFRNGLRHCEGEMTYPNQARFVGKWKINRRDSGTMGFPDGQTFDGSFKDDEPRKGFTLHPNRTVKRFLAYGA